jgi:very-short-patch-repair endonuclease
MGHTSAFDRAALAGLLARQRCVITRQQALSCGLTKSAIRCRIEPGGPWQVLLPGVYLATTGVPARKQLETGAFLYVDDAIAITGPAAVAFHSIPADRSDVIDVLAPIDCGHTNTGIVRVRRTSVDPGMQFQDGVVRFVQPARAIADTARQLTDLRAVRAVVAAGVQRGKATVPELAEELRLGPARGSAQFRAALDEVADGIRSVAEGDLRVLIKRERLPAPLFKARIYAAEELIAVADAWWKEACLAAEVESRQWHLSPEDWERTLARDARMTAHGITVLHFPPRRIRTDGPAVAAEIRAALRASAGRTLPDLRVVPS